jgi:hypothetical protein
VTGEIRGIVDHPFRESAAILTQPASWCEFISLTPNVKACTFQQDGPAVVLTLYLGWRGYRTPEESTAQPYRFLVREYQPEYAALSLRAAEGLLGTRAHRFDVEAADVSGKTVFVLRCSYEPSALSRMVTTVFLATLGRNRIGFSRVESGDQLDYVRGIQGMIERNAMRYYLALKAFLDTYALPSRDRFEARISAAFDLTDAYPAQLRMMEKREYLDIKRRERLNQLRLQHAIGSAAPPAPSS